MADAKEPEALGAERLEKGMRLAFGLASVQPGESVLDAIERLSGTEPRVHLDDAADDDTPVVKVHGKGSEERPADDPRYQILGEIARGGVGVIFKGRDRDLGRDVAIKVLRKDLKASPEVIQRFVEEAQIEGQLQHPGVVPVYGLGVQPDGRPYFAMKLVKGDTLASVLKERRDPAEDRHRLLTVFEQVCQTVAYAHARRVLHRDLKPANVLLGAFGQVQVVDWGFAKVLPRGGVADEVEQPTESELAPELSLIETIRSGPGSTESVVGSVMGTPAYMPPEQARGEPERVNETSDVFSLGAILTQILTGRPPYVEGDARALLVQAAQCRTEGAFERLDASGADRDLVDLAKRCLAPAQSVRPRNASEVAQAIQDHLESVESRARKAELEAVASKTKATEERRRRRLTLALAATVLLAALGAGGTLWYFDAQAGERTRKANAAVARAMQEVVTLRGVAREGGTADLSGWPAAIEEAEAAVALAATTEADTPTVDDAHAMLASLHVEHEEATGQAARAAELAQLERRVADARARRGIEPAHHEARAATVRTVLRDLDIDLDALSPADAALGIRACPLAESLLGAIDAVNVHLADETFAAILQEADSDPWREHVRRLNADGDAAGLVSMSKGSTLERRSTRDLLLLADALSRAENRGDGMRVCRAAERGHPEDLWVNLALAYRFLDLRQPHAALPRLQKVVALRPDLVAPRYFLGLALNRLRDFDGAIRHWRQVVREEPEFPDAKTSLAAALLNAGTAASRSGSLATTLAYFREAGELGPENIDVQIRLSDMYANLGRYRECRAVLLRAVATHPEHAVARANLGGAEVRCWRFEDAITTLERALELEPPETQRVTAYYLLGEAYARVEEPEKALDAREKGLEAAQGEEHSASRVGLNHLKAELHLLGGDLETALDVLEETLEQQPEAWKARWTYLCRLYHRALRLAGREEEAVAFLQNGIDKEIALVRSRPNMLGQIHGVGYLLGKQGYELDPSTVLEELRERSETSSSPRNCRLAGSRPRRAVAGSRRAGRPPCYSVCKVAFNPSWRPSRTGPSRAS